MISVQKKVCKGVGSSFDLPKGDDVAGVAISTANLQPVYGVRLEGKDGESGWYIWGGERSDRPDFFQPLHVMHVQDYFPVAEQFLALSSGYKFIADDEGYKDVWYEPGVE